MTEIIKTVKPRPLTQDEKTYCKAFQNFLRLHQEHDRRDFYDFYRKLQEFDNYAFSERSLKNAGKIIAQLKKIEGSREEQKQALQNLNDRYKPAFETFIKGRDFSQHIPALKQTLVTLHHANLDMKDETKLFIDPTKWEPSIFMTTDFIRSFNKLQRAEVSEMSLDGVYTYLDLNYDAPFDYTAFFMLSLKRRDDPVPLGTQEFSKYIQYTKAGDEDFKKLFDMVDRYLSTNNKKLLPDIFAELRKDDDLLSAMKNLRKDRTLYRGLCTDANLQEIKQTEKENKYVATSLKETAAKRFAMQIGHIESFDNRRCDTSVVIVYDAPAESILFDTRIFGGIFNENEVLIDATKAKIEDIYDV